MVNAKKQSITSFSQDGVVRAIQEASQDSPIIVDFDETLFLRNSTAEYLNSLQPRLIGLLLLKAIAFLKPWKWLDKSAANSTARDWYLVFISTLLMPWNFILWQNIAHKMADKYSNDELIKELNLNPNAKVIVATLGFDFIVRPILNQMSVKSDGLISCGFWRGLGDRTRGKLAMVKESLTDSQIAASILITDSLDDLPLLKEVAQPFLVLWNKAQYVAPMSDLYFPLMYIHKVKRVGENYIAKSILFDDLPILLVAFSWLSPEPVINGIGTLLLFFSFWFIYEFGYYENDVVAEKYENKPRLSDSYYGSPVTINWWQPWIWSLVVGSIGSLLIVKSNSAVVFSNPYIATNNANIINTSLVPLAAWTGFLVVSRFCFWVYNYVNKPTRIWFYFVLQICRYCGLLAIMGTNLVGISILVAQILSRSVSYMVYRYAGGSKENWPKLQEKFLRGFLFILLIVSLSVAEANLSLLFNWQTLAIVAWLIFRGQQHLAQTLNSFGLIFQDKY